MTQRAYRAIRDEILKGKFNGRGRFTEGYLASQLGISKSPIREALNRLETEGLITIIPRRGAFVAQLSAKDAIEVYELREILETAAIRGLVLDEKMLGRLRTALSQAKAAMSAGNKLAYIMADAEFHRVIAQANTNSRLLKILDSMQGQTLILRHRTFEVAKGYSVAEHGKVLEALEKGDKEKAARLMAVHIRAVGRRLLAYLGKQPGASKQGSWVDYGEPGPSKRS